VGQDKEDDIFELDSKKSEDNSINKQEEVQLEELALLLILALLDHYLKDDEYASALISGMAVLGINY
jgi:hypothetical protein